MKNIIKNEEGNVAIMIVTFIGVIAVALLTGLIDISKGSNLKAQFDQNVDNALIAAVSSTTAGDAEKTALAKQYFASNMPDGEGFKLNSLKITTVGDSFEIAGNATVDEGSFLSKIFDGGATFTKTAKAKWSGSKSSEIVFVANVSGTMCTKDVSVSGEDKYKFEKVENCSAVGTASKFNAMKNGFKYMIDAAIGAAEMVKQTSTGTAQYLYKVGIVPFNHKVKMPTRSTVASIVQLPSGRKAGFIAGKPVTEQYTNFAESNLFVDGWDSIKRVTTMVKKCRKGKCSQVPYTTNSLPAGLQNLPTSMQIPVALRASEGALGATYYLNFDDAGPLPMVYPLINVTEKSDKAHMISFIDSMYQDYQGEGWNRSNIGLLTAGLMLDPAQNSSFGGQMPKGFDDAGNEKIVVLISDGANTGCCFASFPGESFEKQYLYEYAVDNAHMIGVQKWKDIGGDWKDSWNQKYSMPAKGVCEILKDSGVKIYTVALGINQNNPMRKKSEDVLKACASDMNPQNDEDGEGYFYSVAEDDTEGLEKVYDKIASSLIKLKLVY